MVEKISLSIITVNYNNRIGLEKTIKSVISQDFINYEFIIIDGGSTDGSNEVIKNYTNYISYWVSEADFGIYHAMNKGIQRARGEYLFFLNSADWLYKSTTLSTIFNYNPASDIILCNVIFMVGNDEELRKGIGKNDFYFKDIFNSWCHQSLLIKRSLFDLFGLYEEKYKVAADWVFLLKSLALGDASFTYIPEVLCYYDNTGISSQSTDWYIEKVEAMKELIPPRILNEYQSKSYNRYYRVRSHKLSHFLFILLNRMVILWQMIFSKRKQ